MRGSWGFPRQHFGLGTFGKRPQNRAVRTTWISISRQGVGRGAVHWPDVRSELHDVDPSGVRGCESERHRRQIEHVHRVRKPIAGWPAMPGGICGPAKHRSNERLAVWLWSCRRCWTGLSREVAWALRRRCWILAAVLAFPCRLPAADYSTFPASTDLSCLQEDFGW